MTKYLACILLGVVLASATFLTRDGLDAYAKLKARVTTIEQFLQAVTSGR